MHFLKIIIKVTIFIGVVWLSFILIQWKLEDKTKDSVENIIFAAAVLDSNRISPNFGFEWDGICLIRPYQEKISDDNYQSTRVNKYLEKINYM